jgi:hypothetical protein
MCQECDVIPQPWNKEKEVAHGSEMSVSSYKTSVATQETA